MRKIDALVLKTYAGPLLVTFFISLFILIMQFMWMYIDDLVGKGLEWYIIGELLFWASFTFVPLALPLAILLSSLMTFGNLGEHYELVALKSAGVSLRAIMKPLVILSILISVFAFYFSNNVLPVANLKFKSLLYDIRKKKLAVNIREGIFYNEMEDYVIRVGKKGKDGKTIYKVMIYNHTEGRGNIDVTVADSGYMETTVDGKYLIFDLFDGYNYKDIVDQKDAKRTQPFQRTFFKSQQRKFDLTAFELNRTDELFKNNYQMLNIRQLNFFIDSLGSSVNTRRTNLAQSFARNYQVWLNRDTSYIIGQDTNIVIQPDYLSAYSGDDKIRITANALTSARNVKKTLEYNVLSIKGSKEYLVKHKIVWHKKFTLSFACLVFFFIGAPLGAIIRKGGLGLPTVISILFFILYYIISMIGEKSALKGAMDVTAGMWLSSAILLPLGFFLTFKATTDSPIMDMDVWNKVFRNINPVRFFPRFRTSPGPANEKNQ